MKYVQNNVNTAISYWDRGHCYRSRSERHCLHIACRHLEGLGLHRDVSSAWSHHHRRHCRLPNSPMKTTCRPLIEITKNVLLFGCWTTLMFCQVKKSGASPGHGLSLHTWVCVSVPSHCGPSNAGGGLLQSLILDCIPLPQVSLQGLHGSQDPQLPATAKAWTV